MFASTSADDCKRLQLGESRLTTIWRTAIVDDLEAREEGFYWVVLGQNPPEIAYWERSEWWLAGDPRPWQPDALEVLSDKLVFRPRPRLVPVA